MGEQTTEFASRFTIAVGELAALADDAGHARLRERHGAGLAAAVRDAVDAVAAVYDTGTDAVRDWPEQARRVKAQVAALRKALERSGVDAEVRRLAGALVAIVEQRKARR